MTRIRFSPKSAIICLIITGVVLLFLQNSRTVYIHDTYEEVTYGLHVPKLKKADSNGITSTGRLPGDEGVPIVETTEKQASSSEKSVFLTTANPPKITILNSDPRKPSVKSDLNAKSDGAKTCNIPKLPVNSPEIEASYKKPIDFGCEKYAENWLYLDGEKTVQYTEFAKTSLNTSSILCQAKYFTRSTDSTVSWTPIPEVIIGKTQFNQGDFVNVRCTAEKAKKWKYLFMTMVPIQSVIEKAKTAKKPERWSGLSVYWFSFDSMSHQAFRRMLPKSVAYLEDVMGTVVLNGYNIVGDGTPQAFIPILTGKTELELPLTRKRYPDAQYVDVYPFIWKNFSEAGYATMYGEDAAAIGTFTYRLKGFKDQPTDHYPRTFFLLSEKFFPSRHCFGNQKQFDVWVKYGTDFMKQYPPDVPKFSVLHHSDLSHDFATQVSTADEALLTHLKDLYEGGFFDNAVVFVGADHGHRFTAIRATQQGQLEERLPFMGIFVPKAFRESEKGKTVYENLKANKDRLTSPFDIHATLEDILSLPEDLTTPQDAANSRSLSLFRPIPADRSCPQADIEPHWCTCLSWQAASAADSALLAQSVVQTINAYTEESRDLCSPLRLDTIVEAKRLIPDEKVLKYGGVKDADGFVPDFKGKATAHAATYMLTFTTLPGNARYEATVLYDSKKNELVIDMLAISHVNKYGDAPHCIIDKNYFLASYCVCYDKMAFEITRIDRNLILAASESTASDRRCETCGKTFANAGAKWMHVVKSHKQVASDVDERMFNKHKIVHRKANSVKFQCPDCPKCFKSQKLVKQHFQKVHQARSFVCRGCSKSFSLQRDLRYHESKQCKKIVIDESVAEKATMTMMSFSTQKNVETQTEIYPVAVTNAGAQVYSEEVYYPQPAPPTYNQHQNNHVVMHHQQTQAFYHPVDVATYTDPHDWVQCAETQTHPRTSTTGTITPMWATDPRNGYVVENGTQTWFNTAATEDVSYGNDRVMMTDSYSMTEDANWG